MELFFAFTGFLDKLGSVTNFMNAVAEFFDNPTLKGVLALVKAITSGKFFSFGAETSSAS